MQDSETFDRYYNLSLRYLSFRPRSEKEINDYLHEKLKNTHFAKASRGKQKLNLKSEEEVEEVINKIINKLKEYKFIDDRQFTKSWVQSRINYKNKPVRVIEYELKQKGINDELILEFLPKTEVRETDLQSAKKLAEKKKDYYRNLDEKKREEKVMSYLLRKGFSYDIVKKAVKV